MNKKDANSINDCGIDFESIVNLISKYELSKKSGKIKRMGEADTKEDFISPLFRALGWNIENNLNRNDSVSREENIAGKRSDYSFRINGIPKFFLEAKSLKEENIQGNSDYVKQAINYAWMKSCSWAILCNFETIAIYNADWKDSNYGNNILFVFHPIDFLTNPYFKMLSKESFEKNELDLFARDNFKKQLKYRIDKQLLQDMIHFREVLSKDIVRNNQDKHLTQDDIDESVQRILDRLIFIRNAEDRGLEGNRIQSVVRQWNGKGHLVKEISGIYKEYDDKYNSKLFAHHLCDDLYIDNEPLQEVIEGLNHSKDNSYRYDFSIIDSDVLGNIYEQYLGNILKSTPKRAKLEESKVHRKEQGIYYTPSYIVDYIVKNTVGEYIKTHKPEEIRKVRILDPACGSGSFLIRSYKELENYWKQQYGTQETLKFDEGESFYSMKVEILKNNIFGVDLDPKAVEIAQLNLLLQISERKHRLPLLQSNIKIGNSTIENSEFSDKAFQWEEEFQDIMKEGGFDIVIGNPPYINAIQLTKSLGNNVKEVWKENYESARGAYDIYVLFIERAIKLCKPSGFVSFITPNKFFSSPYGIAFRSWASSNSHLLRVLDLSAENVFNDPAVYPIVTIFTAIKDDNDYKVKLERPFEHDYMNLAEEEYPATLLKEFPENIWGPLLSGEYKILAKIFKKSMTLSSIASVQATTTAKEADDFSSLISENGPGISIVNTGTIDRYISKYGIQTMINKGEPYLHPKLEVKGITENRKLLYKNPKIIISKLALRLEAFLDEIGEFASLNTNCVHNPSRDYPLTFLTGVLNSKLTTFVYNGLFAALKMRGGYFQFQAPQLRILPIPKCNEQQKIEISTHVQELVKLKKSISNPKGIDCEDNILMKINKIEDKIDSQIYKSYNLSQKEVNVIEGYFSKFKK
jgi:type I restriction-modification system DNA methylase subunit